MFVESIRVIRITKLAEGVIFYLPVHSLSLALWQPQSGSQLDSLWFQPGIPGIYLIF